MIADGSLAGRANRDGEDGNDEFGITEEIDEDVNGEIGKTEGLAKTSGMHRENWASGEDSILKS